MNVSFKFAGGLTIAIILVSLSFVSPHAYAQDGDGDGIPDNLDNCTLAANADQRDTNGDGFGNACDTDLNNDCITNPVDLGLLRLVFFSDDADADFNGDGVVNPVDLGFFRLNFFVAPGPSGVPNICDTVMAVTLSPDNWDANRIGQRQQLTATAFNTVGQSIPDAEFTWESSDTNVAQVDASGIATAFSASSTPVVITATAEDIATTSTLTVTSEVASAIDGIMYTAWFARSDDAPALLVDGRLEVTKDMFCLNINSDPQAWMVCPTHADFPDSTINYDLDGNILSIDDPDGTRNDPGVLPPPPIPSYPNPPDPTTPWPYPEVEKFQWAGDLVGILSDMSQGRGTIRVLDRNQEWTRLATGNGLDFELSGNRIAILIDGGLLRVKDGVFAPFTNLASNVSEFSLEGDFIAALHDDGLFRVKQGINGPWIVLANPGDGVSEFAMELVGTDIRIAEVFDDGRLRVKDGIFGPWTTLEDSGVDQYQLEQDVIGVLREDDTFRVKTGIFGPWTQLASPGAGVKEFALEVYSNEANIRIAEVFDDGRLRVKDGINSAWIDISTGVQSVQLQENYIGALLPDGTLRIKEGPFGGWRNTPAYGSGVAQFRVVVDVPVPPVRTTSASFNASRAQCLQQGSQCYRDRTFGFPSDFYGRFCGGGHPVANDPSWYWAVNLGSGFGGGPMDPMDALCKHHDAAYPLPDGGDTRKWASWYPEGNSGTQYICVTKYGLEFAQLTNNGVPIDISGTNRDDWGGLGDLYDTIYFGINSFWTGSAAGCPDVGPFRASTSAKHNL